MNPSPFIPDQEGGVFNADEGIQNGVQFMIRQNIPKHMHAAVWRGGPELRIEEVPVPLIGTGELLVRVETCGICPTDIKKIDLDLVEPPVILGHEIAGRVVAAGMGAERFSGKRVALYHHIPCRQCRLCDLGRFSQCEGYKKTGTTAGFKPSGGGWAEYVRVLPWIVAGGGVVEIPETLAPEVAILMEPLNTCLKCLESLPARGGCLVIMGQGPVGLMLTAIARRKGWEVLAVEPLPERQEKALAFGAKAVLSPGKGLRDRIHDAAPLFGPDAAIAATDSEEAVNTALRILRPGGTLVLFAHTRKGQPLKIDGGEIGVAEKQMIGSYSSSVELNEEALNILLDEAMPWDAFVTHLFPLEDIGRALMLARHPESGSLKVAVTPEKSKK
ncbi:MAG: alcohol dehydrogenase catalytic domain-containing protein [Pseudomonadota bacterium]